MKTTLKMPGGLLDHIREDLRRPHAFAHERVGFLTAGLCALGDDLMLLARAYEPVDDEDYVFDRSAGATIGSDAMRKATRRAYGSRSALLHLHTHGGLGCPDFSGTDLRSGREFVPGFFHSVPRMAHGMLVLSDNSAAGMLWLREADAGQYIDGFVRVGAGQKHFGERP